MNTEVKIYNTTDQLYEAIALQLLELSKQSDGKAFHLALSGGNSPKGLFQHFSTRYAEKISWSKIHLWWGDERCVPPTDEQSNYKMTREFLLSHISIPKENIHRIKGEAHPNEEALRYGEEINRYVPSNHNSPEFDLILLGLGDDGHTASIFPGQLDLFRHPENCAVAEHPQSKQKRVTLTGRVINNARNIFFLVSGKNKAERVAEIMNDDPIARLHPAYYVNPTNGRLTWFLDNDAAALIR